MWRYCLGLVHGICVGIFCVLAVQTVFSDTPRDLSSAALGAAELREHMSVADMELRIVFGDAWPSPAISGYTDIDRHPCRININADQWMFIATPSWGSAEARWIGTEGRDNFGRVMAHEIYHCLHGQWHPPWSEIGVLNSAFRVMMVQKRDRVDGD